MFFKGHARPLSLRGDTIVEVLLAISILSVVLAGAFASASQSQVNNRASQERVEALKLSQGHVEVLRYIASSGNEEIFDSSTGLFCIDTTNNQIIKFGMSNLPPLETAGTSIYPAKCKNLNTRYNLAIKYDTSSKVFITNARWVKFGASSLQQSEIYYRVHKGGPVATPAPTPGPPGPSCSTISFNIPSPPWRLMYTTTGGRQIYSYTLSSSQRNQFTSGCSYAVNVETQDLEHNTEVDNQPNERIRLEFINNNTTCQLTYSGNCIAKTANSPSDILCNTPLTDDVPSSPQNSISTNVGNCNFSQAPYVVTFKHWSFYTGDSSTANSVEPKGIQFVP